MTIAHIINPVKVDSSSDLFKAQPVTFRTLLKSKKASNQNGKINQYLVGYPEDEIMFPQGFSKLPALGRSVMDVGNFSVTRKLPLIADILNALNPIEADYIVYTNVDIALMPYFYDFLFEKIASGSDSLIINRRVIEKHVSEAQMYAEIGKKHPGYDCFVFKKELLKNFVFENTCIGANFIGRIMYANLLLFSNRLEIIKNAHLTFHIGEDGAWLDQRFNEFDTFNKNQVKQALNKLLELNIPDEKRSKLLKLLTFVENFKKTDSKKGINNSKTSLSGKIWRRIIKKRLLCL